MRLDADYLIKLQKRLHDKSHDEGDCRVFQGAVQPNGYGQMWNGFRPEQAHRIAYRLAFGEIPIGCQIDHKCRNRACINPDHLQAVSHKSNMHLSDAVMGVNHRKTHCKRGHALSGDNLYITPKGYRQCRECDRLKHIRQRANKRELLQ